MEETQTTGDFTPSSMSSILSGTATGSEPERVETAPDTSEGAAADTHETTESTVEAAGNAEVDADEEVDLEAEPAEDLNTLRKQVAGFKKASIKERKKRQALEEKLAAQILPQSQPQPQAQPKQIDYYEDPQRYVDNRVVDATVNLSIDFARRAHADFDEKRAIVVEAARQNPALHNQILSSANPGEEIYQIGKSIQFYKKHGTDPSAIEASIEKELTPKIRAKVEKELLGKIQDRKNQPTNILAGRSASGAAEPEWRPATMAEILRGNPR